jgi:hypothetical protein
MPRDLIDRSSVDRFSHDRRIQPRIDLVYTTFPRVHFGHFDKYRSCPVDYRSCRANTKVTILGQFARKPASLLFTPRLVFAEARSQVKATLERCCLLHSLQSPCSKLLGVFWPTHRGGVGPLGAHHSGFRHKSG